jgi:hypothetical protein
MPKLPLPKLAEIGLFQPNLHAPAALQFGFFGPAARDQFWQLIG